MEYNREKSPLLVKSQAFAVRIINMVDYLSSNRDGRFKSIYDQVLRSGTSIMANVRESQFAQSKADFICKLQIALKEANESAYWFEVLLGLHEDLTELQVLTKEAGELRSLLQSIITSVKRTGKD